MNDHNDSNKETRYEPLYSGPNKVGICICGHPWQEHHLSVVMNAEYREATGEACVPEECEHFGCNETGGMEYKDGKWIDHCHRYEDAGSRESR